MRLGEIATYINGYAFKPEDWGEEGLPIIRIQDLTGTSYQLNYYEGEYPEKIEINNGDVLISWSASIGVYIWDKGKALLNQHIFKVQFDKVNIEKNYFVYAVKYNLGAMVSQMHGATMKHIVKKDFDSIEIPYPTMEEQKLIAEKLRCIETIISFRKQQLEQFDTLIKARFVEMFGDVIKNEKQWEIRAFSDIASSRLGKMLDSKKQTGDHSFPYLANYNVQWFRFELDDLKQMDFDETEQQEFQLKEGDLLVCEGGEIGRCAIWHNQVQPCYFQKALHRVRCNPKIINPNYLAWWFKFNSEQGGFDSIAGAKATIAHLPGVKLKGLRVAIPPIDMQNQFSGFVSQVDKSKVAVQKALDEAQLLFDSLMQQYFG